MLIGQSVLAPSGAAVDYYTPWFTRRGDVLRAVIQYLNKSGALTTFSCQVQTKNNEDSDNAPSNVGSSFSIGTTTPGEVTTSSNLAGCKELVRYKITLQGSGALRWVHYRTDEPIWLPN